MIKDSGEEIKLINSEYITQIYLDKTCNAIELENGMLLTTKYFQAISYFYDENNNRYIEFLGYIGDGDFNKDRAESNWESVLEIFDYQGEILWVDFIGEVEEDEE